MDAVILHGSGESPESFWYPSIRDFLEQRGFEVWVPELPESTGEPRLDEQLPFVMKQGAFTEDTVLIGHSSGAPLVLSVLERVDVTVAKAVLVAGYCMSLGDESDLMLQDSYDWDAIGDGVEELYCVNSRDDPWGCDDEQALHVYDNVDATVVLCHGEGHFGSHTFDQEYREFPLLERLL